MQLRATIAATITLGLTITDEASKYTRIAKRNARKLFTEGKSFYIIAHRMRPGFPFSMGMMLHSSEYIADYKASHLGDINLPERLIIEAAFERALYNFAYYNCTFETGYFPAFYIVEERQLHCA